jgi:hypothetical protein
MGVMERGEMRVGYGGGCEEAGGGEPRTLLQGEGAGCLSNLFSGVVAVAEDLG